MLDRRSLLRGTAFAFGLAPFFASGADAEGADERFLGLGVEVWPSERVEPLLTAAIRDLNISFVRIGSGGHDLPASLSGDVSAQQIADALEASSPPETNEGMLAIAAYLRSRKLKTHIVVWEAPRRWRSLLRDNHDENEFIANCAKYVVGCILLATKRGFPDITVEIANEPNGDWNTFWEPANFARYVLAVRREIDKAGLHVGIEAPGTSSQKDAPPYLEALAASGAAAALTAISVHDWAKPIDSKTGLQTGFRQFSREVSPSLPIYVTEFNDDSSVFKGPEVGHHAGPGTLSTLAARTYAVAVVDRTLQLVADRVTGICVWQLQDQFDEHQSYGLFDEKGNARPVFEALATVFRTVRGPARIVAATLSTGIGTACRFSTGESVTVAISNVSPSPATVVLNRHVFGLVRPMRVSGYVVQEADAPIMKLEEHAESVSVTLPPNSITVCCSD